MQAQEITLMHVCFLTFKFHLRFVNEALFLVNKEQAACLKHSGTGRCTNAHKKKNPTSTIKWHEKPEKTEKTFFVCVCLFILCTQNHMSYVY